jgi:uncharacterized protein (DUF433 family)
MALTATRYEHIALDDQGVPLSGDTPIKVVELVTAQMAYGWSPDELNFQFPHLTLGQIHSALAYYWDHRDELDRDIERRLSFADELRQRAQPTPLHARLRERGLIR